MSENTTQALKALERLLEGDAVSFEAALQTAYHLGKLDGQLLMAGIDHDRVPNVMKEAA